MAVQPADGDRSFLLGKNSALDPSILAPGSYAWAVNVLNSGGTLQTRPGFDVLWDFPQGKLQGGGFFYPKKGFPQLLVFVSGQGYVADYPFTFFRAVPGATMSAIADKVYTERATKTVQRNPDGSLKLISPKRLLMIQDGLSVPAYYDGASVVRDANIIQGTHMKWSGSRLWVTRRNEVYASDISDPVSFLEQVTNTLGGVQKWILPAEATGMAEISSTTNPILLVFTASTVTSFLTSIQNRDLWPDTENFQRVVLDNIGATSDRSITSEAGQLWWMSLSGVTRLDAAVLSLNESRMTLMDSEMQRSKSFLGDLSKVASVAHQGLLLASVPYASKQNAHTWVLNGSPVDLLNQDAPATWSSIWTGVQPVQWLRLTQDRRAELFCLSVDKDGGNRLYRAFNGSRKDNNCDIPCAVELRAYSGGSNALKYIRWAQYFLSELAGQVDLRVLWAGMSRGRWKDMGTVVIKASDAEVSASRTYTSATILTRFKKQSRRKKTLDPKEADEESLTSGGVQVEESEKIDEAFSLRFEWTGRAAIRSVRQWLDMWSEPFGGDCEPEEDDDIFERADGATSEDLSKVQGDEPPVYSSTQRVTVRYGNFAKTTEETATSLISESDAIKRAKQIASARANFELRRILPKYQGGSLSPGA